MEWEIFKKHLGVPWSSKKKIFCIYFHHEHCMRWFLDRFEGDCVCLTQPNMKRCGKYASVRKYWEALILKFYSNFCYRCRRSCCSLPKQLHRVRSVSAFVSVTMLQTRLGRILWRWWWVVGPIKEDNSFIFVLSNGTKKGMLQCWRICRNVLHKKGKNKLNKLCRSRMQQHYKHGATKCFQQLT